jgi:hypothetical protein
MTRFFFDLSAAFEHHKYRAKHYKHCFGYNRRLGSGELFWR